MKEIKHIVHAFLLLLAFIAALICLKVVYSIRAPESTIALTEPRETKPELFSKGRQLFQAKCGACHSLFTRSTGPSLCGFESRGTWTDRENIYRWINNPVEFMQTDEYTSGLKESYKVTMTAFPELTRADIDEIINYINRSCEPSVVKN